MPYYIRTPTGSQIYGAGIDALPALSVRVDAGLVRAAYADTWEVAGDGLPLPTEATVVVYTASQTPGTPVVPASVGAVGWEDTPSGMEWERAVLGVRGVRIVSGGLYGTGTELRLILAQKVAYVYRWVDGVADELVDHTSTPLVFLEEV